MYQNEAGIEILETCDVVRIGKGRVHWVVTQDETTTEGGVSLCSSTSSRLRWEARESLTLVQNVRDTEEWKAHNQEASVKEDTEYQKAVLLALNTTGRHVYAGTVRPNVKAKRRSLGRRQRASRKANR